MLQNRSQMENDNSTVRHVETRKMVLLELDISKSFIGVNGHAHAIV